MNLEEVERKCLAYLTQVRNPLVPVSQLMRHLGQDKSIALPSRDELVHFLRHHELFRVIEPVGLATEAQGAKALEQAGMISEPVAILSTRIPSEQEMSELLREQIRKIVSSLFLATREAQESGDEERFNEAKAILQRASLLQEKLEEVIGSKKRED